MHTLCIPLASITALLVVLNQWLGATPFDEALVTGLGLGLAAYLLLLLGDTTVQAFLSRRRSDPPKVLHRLLP